MRQLFAPVFAAAVVGAGFFGPWLAAAAGEPSEGSSEASASARSADDLPDTVTLTREQMDDRHISVSPAGTGSVDATVTAPATVEFAPSRVTRIGPRLPAKVVRATVDLGDAVQAGDRVAILDSVELGKVKAHYLSLRASLALARQEYQREKRLASQKISSQAALQKARAGFEQARADLNSTAEELRLYGLTRKQIDAIHAGTDEPFSRYALTTPRAGIVEKLAISPGQTLTPDTTPIEVVDPSRMWVMIDAFEKDVERIEQGQQVTFQPRAVDDVTVSGRVDWVARSLSPTTRTLRVRATVANPNGTLRSGMFGTARIRTDAGTDRVVLPVDAVQTVHGTDVVFRPVSGKPRTFSVVPVRLGKDMQGRVEILAGVSPGDPVVTRGSFALMAILTAGSRQDTD